MTVILVPTLMSLSQVWAAGQVQDQPGLTPGLKERKIRKKTYKYCYILTSSFSKPQDNRVHIGPKMEIRVVTLGLDGAGKTTILFKLKQDEFMQPIPTIGKLEY